MEKMSLLKLMYAQIMANDNNGIYPHNLYERRGPKFNPNYTVKENLIPIIQLRIKIQ